MPSAALFIPRTYRHLVDAERAIRQSDAAWAGEVSKMGLHFVEFQPGTSPRATARFYAMGLLALTSQDRELTSDKLLALGTEIYLGLMEGWPGARGSAVVTRVPFGSYHTSEQADDTELMAHAAADYIALLTDPVRVLDQTASYADLARQLRTIRLRLKQTRAAVHAFRTSAGSGNAELFDAAEYEAAFREDSVKVRLAEAKYQFDEATLGATRSIRDYQLVAIAIAVILGVATSFLLIVQAIHW